MTCELRFGLLHRLAPTLTWSPLGSPTVDYAVFSAKTTTSTASEATPDALRGAGSVGSGQHAPFISKDHPGSTGVITIPPAASHRAAAFGSVGPGLRLVLHPPHASLTAGPGNRVSYTRRAPLRGFRLDWKPWYPVRADRSVLTRGVGPYMRNL